MDFKISDELESMRKMAYDFAVKNIKPTMEEDEKEHKYRPELFEDCAKDAGLEIMNYWQEF